MTVQSTTNRTDAVADGIQTVFPYDYYLISAQHMFVLFDGVDEPSGWTVDGVGNPSGGNVTFAVPPVDAVTVTLIRVVPLTQEVDYTEYDPFPAEVAETALDLEVMRDQQASEDGGRHVSFSVNELPAGGSTLATPIPNQAIGYDGGGNLTNLDVTGGTGSLGDVNGPDGAIDGNFAAFDTTTGKLIKDSTFDETSFAPIAHVGSGSDLEHAEANGLVSGFMSPENFSKLAGIGVGAQNNTASTPNAGGEELTMAPSGADLPFKTLIAGTNVTLTPITADAITINATDGGGGATNIDELTDAVATATSVALGDGSGVLMTGLENAILGIDAAPVLTTGEKNVVVGYNALLTLGEGNQIIAVGWSAGSLLTGGANNIIIGANAQASGTDVQDELTLGNVDITRWRIPGLNLDTADAADTQVMAWNTTNGGFDWVANGGGGGFPGMGIQFGLDSGENKLYTLDQAAGFAYTITDAAFQTDTNTIAFQVRIDSGGGPVPISWTVTGTTPLTVGASPSTATAASDNVVGPGDKVTILLSGDTSATGVSIKLNGTKI